MTALLEYIDLLIKVGFFKVNSAKLNLCSHCRLGRTPSYGPDCGRPEKSHTSKACILITMVTCLFCIPLIDSVNITF